MLWYVDTSAVVKLIVAEPESPARGVLEVITILKVSTSIFEIAGRLDPVDLRSLDAVHIAEGA
jgi:predicted nucleic acid-binding protein